jgi:hypothetical protein
MPSSCVWSVLTWVSVAFVWRIGDDLDLLLGELEPASRPVWMIQNPAGEEHQDHRRASRPGS